MVIELEDTLSAPSKQVCNRGFGQSRNDFICPFSLLLAAGPALRREDAAVG